MRQSLEGGDGGGTVGIADAETAGHLTGDIDIAPVVGAHEVRRPARGVVGRDIGGGVGTDLGGEQGSQLGDPRREIGRVGTIEAEVARLLAQHELHLGHLVVEIGVVVVEVFLVEVEEHADMGCATDALQLVTGEFSHDESVGVDLRNDVEQGDAHVARKEDRELLDCLIA